MINSIEILEQLRKGKSIEQIGKEIGSVLTLAQNQYEEEVAKQIAEQQKLDTLVAVCAELADWLDEYYPSMSQNLTETELTEIAKSLIATFEEVSKYGETLFHAINTLKTPTVQKIKVSDHNLSGVDWQDLINQFING